MIEKVQNTLQKKLQKQKKTAEESKDHVVNAVEPSTGEGAAVPKKRRGPKAKDKAKIVAKVHYGPIMNLIYKTRFLPSLQLFDAIWRVVFYMSPSTSGGGVPSPKT
jgi:hypothetical protein